MTNYQNDDDIEKVDESSSSEIKKPFDPTKIDITVKPLIIDSLIKRMNSTPMRIDLNSEFQRMGNLWKPGTQSRLIESLLVRIPLPAFYFDGTDDNKWKIVDGLQRISTLKNFIIAKSLILQDLEYLKQYNGFSFDDLDPYLQGRIEETQITAYIINPGTPGEVKYNLFKRINTGGLILTPQEIRHALNQGIPADFIKTLASLKVFHKATDNGLSNKKRMEDRDFVTRFVGFYDGFEDYQPDLDNYLNDKMATLNFADRNKREQIKNSFAKAMHAAINIFNNDAFRKRYNSRDSRKPLNKALFDTWSVNLAKLDQNEIEILIQNKSLVKEKFWALMNGDRVFERSITSATGDSNAVKTRFSKIENLLREVIDDQ